MEREELEQEVMRLIDKGIEGMSAGEASDLVGSIGENLSIYAEGIKDEE